MKLEALFSVKQHFGTYQNSSDFSEEGGRMSAIHRDRNPLLVAIKSVYGTYIKEQKKYAIV